MNQLTNTQECLDKHSKEMPEGVYLELCNNMKKDYKEVKENHKVTIKVFYSYPVLTVDNLIDDGVLYGTDLRIWVKKTSQIIQIERRHYDNFNDNNNNSRHAEFQIEYAINREICEFNPELVYRQSRCVHDDCECDGDDITRSYTPTVRTDICIYKCELLD